MNYNPEIHQRRATRLPGYDYSQQGAYFVTICAHNRECLFGDVGDGEIKLNNLGQLVYEEWLYTENIRPEVHLDGFVVMPNHLHGVITIASPRTVGAHGREPLHAEHSILYRKPRSLGSLIAGFKSAATKRINQFRHTPGQPVWQRNYYEHIIRDEMDLDRIRRYIQENPAKWAEDAYNPANVSRRNP
jgi:REP element-mobilizing transposase RayT